MYKIIFGDAGEIGIYQSPSRPGKVFAPSISNFHAVQ
jgi:hypothetical protein